MRNPVLVQKRQTLECLAYEIERIRKCAQWRLVVFEQPLETRDRYVATCSKV